MVLDDDGDDTVLFLTLLIMPKATSIKTGISRKVAYTD
jgi:hypothetical protein